MSALNRRNPTDDSEQPCICGHTKYHHLGMANSGVCVRCTCLEFVPNLEEDNDAQRAA